MKPFPLAQLRSIVGGKPLSPAPEGEALLRAICTDTRQLDPGCLFVAIRGDNHDGHAFVAGLQSVQHGGRVTAALVERDPGNWGGANGGGIPAGVYVLQVASTRTAMAKLASHLRDQFTGNVIAVGGSNGKTTTKHLIDSALRRKLQGSISPKSFNNDIGVPLTMFNHDPSFDYLVLEMGTNHHGELKVLSDMARPDVAVITSISHEHLEGLSDLSGVRREEASIISGLDPKGLLVVNGDDAELMPHLAPFAGRKVTFGFGTHNDLFASNIRLSAEGTTFNLNNSRREVFVPLLGRPTATNALAAIAVARRLGLEEDDIIASLAVATGPEMRQQVQRLAGVTVLNDAYNANPASVRAALETLLAISPGVSGRRTAVLGEMRELGDAAEDLHRQIGEHAAGLGLDQIVFVGRQAALMRDAAIAAGYPAGRVWWYPESKSAAGDVATFVSEGDLVLLKGSRGVRLEVIAEALAVSEPKAGVKIAG